MVCWSTAALPRGGRPPNWALPASTGSDVTKSDEFQARPASHLSSGAGATRRPTAGASDANHIASRPTPLGCALGPAAKVENAYKAETIQGQQQLRARRVAGGMC